MDEKVLGEAIGRLLKKSKRPEDNIRQDIGWLLDGLGEENILTWPTPAGPADIYLPRRRMIIETKVQGKADNPDHPQAGTGESPRAQLERYVHSEIIDELGRGDDRISKRRWTGIVTDGRGWHVWTYAHRLPHECCC